jgi:hypothetical protein
MPDNNGKGTECLKNNGKERNAWKTTEKNGMPEKQRKRTECLKTPEKEADSGCRKTEICVLFPFPLPLNFFLQQ